MRLQLPVLLADPHQLQVFSEAVPPSLPGSSEESSPSRVALHNLSRRPFLPHPRYVAPPSHAVGADHAGDGGDSCPLHQLVVVEPPELTRVCVYDRAPDSTKNTPLVDTQPLLERLGQSPSLAAVDEDWPDDGLVYERFRSF